MSLNFLNSAQWQCFYRLIERTVQCWTCECTLLYNHWNSKMSFPYTTPHLRPVISWIFFQVWSIWQNKSHSFLWLHRLQPFCLLTLHVIVEFLLWGSDSLPWNQDKKRFESSLEIKVVTNLKSSFSSFRLSVFPFSVRDFSSKVLVKISISDLHRSPSLFCRLNKSLISSMDILWEFFNSSIFNSNSTSYKM